MRNRRESAFSLVEVALALGIAAFALVAVFGLLPLGITSNQNSVEQTIAAGVATAVAADLRATPAGTVGSSASVLSSRYQIPIPGSGGGESTLSPPLYLKEDASVQTTASAARYQVNVTLTAPAAGRAATMARILVTWPPSASVTPPNYSSSFEVMTAFNRN
jgi:uncharacterized protein (TIGR02598 family)